MIETTGSAGLSALIKIYGLKLIGGVLAVAISFAFLWPKTAKEGVVRIGATIGVSILCGSILAQWVYSFFPWWPRDVEAAMIIYVAAGLPAWWVLGFIFKWLHTRQDKDAAEIIRELRP